MPQPLFFICSLTISNKHVCSMSVDLSLSIYLYIFVNICSPHSIFIHAYASISFFHFFKYCERSSVFPFPLSMTAFFVFQRWIQVLAFPSCILWFWENQGDKFHQSTDSQGCVRWMCLKPWLRPGDQKVSKVSGVSASRHIIMLQDKMDAGKNIHQLCEKRDKGFQIVSSTAYSPMFF